MLDDLPGLPRLECSDTPSFVYRSGLYPAGLQQLVDQFSNVGDADWVFGSTRFTSWNNAYKPKSYL